jgi:hypothetical protein
MVVSAINIDSEGKTSGICEMDIDFFFCAFIKTHEFLLKESGSLEIVFVIP